jgi:hypothetical protein
LLVHGAICTEQKLTALNSNIHLYFNNKTTNAITKPINTKKGKKCILYLMSFLEKNICMILKCNTQACNVIVKTKRKKTLFLCKSLATSFGNISLALRFGQHTYQSVKRKVAQL